MSVLDYQKTTKTLLGVLGPRHREVIERRFGLNKKQRETLEAIGQDYGLTRERIRQIQDYALAKVREESPKTTSILVHFEKKLEDWGGLKREDKLIEGLGGEKFANQILFLLALGQPFERKKEDREFYTLWLAGKKPLSLARKTVSRLEKFLEKEKALLCFEDLFGAAKKYVLAPPEAFNKNCFLSFIEATKKIEQGPTGLFGLAHWPEVSPRGVRDRAYLALKETEKPLHFRDITELINANLKKEGAGSPRKALPQTVHNELIKDPRFVLVGRGLYALKEWGYEEGTVKDIIFSVLKEKKKPLTREEILQEVSRQRLVQPNTILLGLGDKTRFQRDERGRYTLNKS